jgi:chromosome segregation protein
MFLKRLDLFGFKSFADKTSFEFEPGITLVVGPNGSGKSNVADAIRWVLGEQSVKALRGGKMEDVIFAGSEKRKSLGMAEVSLTIDNTSGGFPLDFQEVTITRRLYRSGESEYLINKVPCRLRDIHELFMDTGVGREGFSMIGQGRVEEILLARPDEKRMILEDAAGIIKYRYRKKEAAKKLDETGQHLLRIEDLLLELKGQEEPLSRQAEEAKAYRLIKEELGGLERGMLVGDIRQATDRAQSLRREIGALDEAILAQRTGFLSAQGQGEGLRLALDQANDQLSALQEEIYKHGIEKEKLENSRRAEAERGEAMEKQAEAISAEVGKLELELQEHDGELASRREQEAALAEQVAKTRALMEEEEAGQKEAEAESAAKREALESGENDHFELLRKESGYQNQEAGHQEQLASASRLRERLLESGQKLEQDRAKAKAQVASLEARRTLHLAESAQTEKNIQAADALLREREDRYLAKQQDNRALAGERGKALTRYKLLEDMEKEGQGYAQGVREILQRRSKERLPGIIGTVAQSLKVDKEYELAVEIVLGGQAQNVITETERSAQDAIRWLKNFDKGRVTFLPLDTIVARPVNEASKPKGKGIIGRLADLVDFEDRLLPIMEFLLGRIWLVDELSNAVARARETGFQYRMVTLDGQMVNAGGSLTGGSARTSGGGFISRRRQLEELDRDIRQMSKDLVAGEGEEDSLHGQRDEAKADAEALMERQRQSALALAALEKDLSHSQQEEKRLAEEREMMDRQQEEEEQEKARITAVLQGLALEREHIARDIEDDRKRIEAIKEEIQIMESQRASRQSRLTELRVRLAEDTQRMSNFDEQGGMIRARMGQLQNLIASQKDNIALCLSRSKQYRQAAEQCQRGMQGLEEKLLELEARKDEAMSRRLGLQQEAADLDENQKAVSAELEKNQERHRQLQVQEGRLEANLELWKGQLSEQFSLDWEVAMGTVEPVQERRKGQQRAKELREELEAMPEVNLAAVREYDELVERLAFMTGQTEDMRQAIADLEAVIRENDAIVVKKFKEVFEEVSEQFTRIFQRLFDGGDARLILTQPDNLLETGVDIIAQPPGKKLQHLSLLSGGEKSLSAISLLMAMLRVRPSPFSILDEIESNLDDANVDRFAGLIREYRENGSQFIIITHRRGTMVAGDVIYGISAQEYSGVSRILSVRLEEAGSGAAQAAQATQAT